MQKDNELKPTNLSDRLVVKKYNSPKLFKKVEDLVRKKMEQKKSEDSQAEMESKSKAAVEEPRVVSKLSGFTKTSKDGDNSRLQILDIYPNIEKYNTANLSAI